MTGPDDAPVPADAHLRAALRHAPDRDIAPPPQLREQLARAARAAVAGPASPPPQPWWQRVWAGLAAPRPVWAGALGTLLVASLTLRLWWGEPPPAVVTDPPEAAAGAAPQAEAPRVAAASAPDAAPAAAPTVPPAAPPSPAPATIDRRAAPAPAPAPAPGITAPPAARPRAATAAAPATERADAPPATADMVAAPTPPAAEPTAAATAAPSPPAAPAPAAIAQADAARGAAMSKSVAPPMQQSMLRGAPPSPLSALRERATAALQAGDDWRWQPARSPAPQAMDAAALATLARIDQASLGRWRPDTQPAGDATVPMLRWWRGDLPQGTLRIEPDALHFTDAAGRRWRAELPPEVIATLLPP